MRHTELATEEDKAWGIDHWAKLFKATIWEELRMMAQNSEYMAEAANSIFRMNADDMVRKRCLDREEYYRDIRAWKEENEEQAATIKEQASTIKEMEAALEEKDAEIAHLRKLLLSTNDL